LPTGVPRRHAPVEDITTRGNGRSIGCAKRVQERLPVQRGPARRAPCCLGETGACGGWSDGRELRAAGVAGRIGGMMVRRAKRMMLESVGWLALRRRSANSFLCNAPSGGHPRLRPSELPLGEVGAEKKKSLGLPVKGNSHTPVPMNADALRCGINFGAPAPPIPILMVVVEPSHRPPGFR